MRVIPAAAAQLPAPVSTAMPSQTAAGQRAIAMLTGQQPAAQVVQNQSQVSAEEMGAIRQAAPPSSEQIHVDEPSQEATDAPQEEPKKAKTPDDEALSQRLAMLARREKQLRAKAQQQEQAYKAKEEALKAREASIASKDQDYQSQYISKQRFQQDPWGTLSELGLDANDLANQLVNQQQIDPRLQSQFQKLQDEIKALKAENENVQKVRQAQEQSAYDTAIKQITADARALVKNDPEFEAIRATNSVSDVVDLIKRTYAEEDRVMTVEEAALEVENYLVEESLKLTRLQKIQRKLGQAATAKTSPAQQPAASPKQQQPLKTLTNNISSTRQLSARERALLAFRGELK